MESPQMYDNSSQSIVQIELKKVLGGGGGSNSVSSTSSLPSALLVGLTATMAANSTSNGGQSNNNNNSANNNNNSATINLNNPGNMQQLHMQQQQQAVQQCVQNNNQNVLLQKQMQQYSQSDLEELTSQEISLDLQHLIDDQFRDPESIGIFTEMVTATANGQGVNGSLQSISKVLQQQQQQAQQQIRQNNNNNNNGYNRSTLAYMPQPVHQGATYTNNSSDENSSVGSDLTTTSIKEEPVDPIEYRRQLAAANGIPFPTTNGTLAVSNNGHNGNLYQTPPNYASNGSGNTFTTLTSGNNLHHAGNGGGGNGTMNGNGLGQILPHLPTNAAAHLVSLKHKQQHHNQMMGGGGHRKHGNKHADKGTDEYRRRRERNNIAVRKSREKAKVRSREVEEKVKALIKEKDSLIRRLEEMTNEMQLHKQLYMHLMNHSNPEIIQICRSMLNLVNINDHVM